MSKILLVFSRSSELGQDQILKIRQICDDLNPKNITPSETELISDGKLAYGIANPGAGVHRSKSGILLGQIFGQRAKWDRLDQKAPDGNYALFRYDEEVLEVVSDILGSRSIWYFQDSEEFIVSTSQRAIIQYTSEFQFNHEVIPWFLCNGSLGPMLSWDKRLRLLPPDSRLRIDRQSWEVICEKEDIKFKPNTKSDAENEKELKAIIRSTLSNLFLNYSEWSLALSGGYDSRGILAFLPKKDESGHFLRTITWGLDGNEQIKGNDAFIARQLAKKHHLEHRYFSTNVSFGHLQDILELFITNGEGRIDHISGYMDGFQIWRELFEGGVSGIIRGDEVFGSYNFASDFHLKKFIGLSLPEDYRNLKSMEYLASFSAKVPESLRKQADESKEEWRDRLYQAYYAPVVLSALADLKHGYVDQINPLLSRQIVTFVRSMPDHLRTEKKTYKKVVRSTMGPVPIAKNAAVQALRDILHQPEFREVVLQELNSDLAAELFPETFLRHITEKVRSNRPLPQKSLYHKVKDLVPKPLKKRLLRRKSHFDMDYTILSFRIFLVIKMVELFRDESIKRIRYEQN